MSWINFSSVTVSNGSKTVKINSGLTTNVKVGDALLIGNEAPVEISGVFASQLILRSNWPNPTATNAAAAVMPTSGEFTTATQALREATNVTQGNFAEMEKWWTETGTVTFKAYDNTEHVVRTAKEMDNAVTDLETGLESVVANKVAQVSPANIDWDLDIPFNEGGELARGFADRNTYGQRAVAISRATVSSNWGKSGELETVAVDECVIGSQGVGIYNSATNDLTYSELIGDSATGGWFASKASVSTNAEIAPNGLQTATTVVESTADGEHYVDKTLSVTAGESVGFSVYLKKDTNASRGLYLRLATGVNAHILVNPVDGNIFGVSNCVSYGVEDRGDYWLAWITAVAVNTGNLVCRYQMNNSISTPATSYIGDGLSSLTLWGAQLTKGIPALFPYISTQGSPVTRSPDVLTVPVSGNLPEAGQAFTIASDAAFPLGADSIAWGVAPDESSSHLIAFMLRRRGDIDSIQFYYDDATATDRFISIPNIDAKPHRFICTYDGGTTTKLYIDGVLKGSNSQHQGKDHSPFAFFTIGRWGGVFLNSTFKNFRIKHRELSADEVAALGAA